MATLTGGQNILLVDDEVQVAQTLEMIFLSRGYKVRIAHSAEEAIDAIADWEPELAIVDVMLPHMNGIELSEVLRANHPNCQVVLMSGHPATGDLVQSLRRDGQPLAEVLMKPLHPAHILEIVAGLLPGVAGEA
ncbi:MAG: response regulator [Acidobacteriota bacterium]